MSKMMKVFRIRKPLEMTLEDSPVPEIQDDEVLVQVKAVGICGTDIELYDGSMPYYRQGLSQMPIIVGHEWSGTVAAVGDSVHNVQIGDLVVGDISIGCGVCQNCLRGLYHLCSDRTELGVIRYDGAFADYLKTKGKSVYRVPEGITPAEAALTEPAATALYGIRKLQLEPGDRVAVLGDGTIGLLAAQFANHCGGSRVAVIALKDTHRALVEKWGMALINSTTAQDLNAAVRQALGGDPDVVVEATGNPSAYNTAIHLVRPGGKLCAVSITGKDAIESDLDYLVTRDITMIGMLASPNAFDPALRMIQAGKIDVLSCITHTFPFEQTKEACDFARDRSVNIRIKTIILHGNPL